MKRIKKGKMYFKKEALRLSKMVADLTVDIVKRQEGSTEYQEIKKRVGADNKTCDRCGNDLSHGSYFLHLPFKKQYVKLCGICQGGLTYGYYLEMKRELFKKEEK